MKKKSLVLMLLVLFLSAGTFVCAQDAMDVSTDDVLAFGGIVTGTESAKASVEAIDKATRTVTLKSEKGIVRDVICGPEVINFDQIKQGDTVTMTVSQYAQVTVMKDTSAPLSSEVDTEISRAPLGEKPAGSVTTSVKVMGIVEDIDHAKRVAVLKGPERTVTVEVGPEAVNFDKVKKGDNVYLEFTERTDVAVTTP